MQRLRTRAQFQAVLGVRPIAHTTHFALHRCPQVTIAADAKAAASKLLFPPNEASIGAIIPKRWAKRAVTRNLLKRQVHQLSVLHKDLFPCAAHVVRLRAALDPSVFVSASSPALRKAVAEELRQLIRLAAPVDETIS